MIFPSFISESDEAFDAFVSYQRADNDTTILHYKIQYM